MASTDLPMRAHRLKDKQLQVTLARPADAGTTYSTDIDLGAIASVGSNISPGGRFADCELLIEGAAIAATLLPTGATIKFSILSATADPTTFDGSDTVEAADIVTLTGDGNEIPAQNIRYRLYSNFPRYVGIKVVAADGTGTNTVGDISGTNWTISVVT